MLLYTDNAQHCTRISNISYRVPSWLVKVLLQHANNQYFIYNTEEEWLTPHSELQ